MTSTLPYAFTNTPAQLRPLTAFLDPITHRSLERLGLEPGARCLSLGAGSGTVADMLSELVGPAGHVTAADLNVSLLRERPHLTVVAHDLREPGPLPGEAPFDLVEARLLTQHLANREDLLTRMTQVLAPGGSILLGEFVERPRVLSAPTGDDAGLLTRVIDALMQVLTDGGIDMDWGNRQHAHLSAAGLECVQTRWHAETWAGASIGIQLLIDNLQQKRDALLGAVTDDDLTRATALLQHPGVTVRSYEFACTVGRRPDTRPLP